jgi:hypothetical protein
MTARRRDNGPLLWTLRRIAVPISCGLSEREVATEHGESVKWVRTRMTVLREELVAEVRKG